MGIGKSLRLVLSVTVGLRVRRSSFLRHPRSGQPVGWTAQNAELVGYTRMGSGWKTCRSTRRGYIYLTGGAQQGLYILRYTGTVKN